MTIILALDTSTEACSAAVLKGNDVYQEYAVCPREHNKRILAMVDTVLKAAQVSLADVDAIAFGSGPGSFTGVRITTGIVQGLAFAANKPVVAVSSLAAMAHSLYRETGQERVIAAIDARMNEIYLGCYQIHAQGLIEAVIDENVTAAQAALLPLEKDLNWAAIGTSWQTYKNELSAQIDADIHDSLLFPQAHDVALIALNKLETNDTVTAEQVAPSYLRNEVAWKKMPGRG